MTTTSSGVVGNGEVGNSGVGRHRDDGIFAAVGIRDDGIFAAVGTRDDGIFAAVGTRDVGNFGAARQTSTTASRGGRQRDDGIFAEVGNGATASSRRSATPTKTSRVSAEG